MSYFRGHPGYWKGKHRSEKDKETIRRAKAGIHFTPLHCQHLKEARLKYLQEHRRSG